MDAVSSLEAVAGNILRVLFAASLVAGLSLVVYLLGFSVL